jgi:hypothetical protein
MNIRILDVVFQSTIYGDSDEKNYPDHIVDDQLPFTADKKRHVRAASGNYSRNSEGQAKKKEILAEEG